MERLPLRVSRWDKHKICSKHGLQHLMLKDFDHPSQTGMCSHPECIGAILKTLENNPKCGGLIKFCKKLDRDMGESNFMGYVVITLLSDAKKGKPTVLNPYHMRWCCLNYLSMLRRQEVKDAKHKEVLEQIGELLEFEIDEMVKHIGLGMFTASSSPGSNFVNPEKAYALTEIISMTIKEYDTETYLWLIGELSDLDYCKISGKQHHELKGVRENYKKWYHKITNDVHL